MNVKRLCRMAVLTALALGIFILELQLPPLFRAVPGIRLGLANIITLYAMFTLGAADTACILTARILLGGIFSGQAVALIYSASGGLLCYFAMLLMRKILTRRQIWVCGVFSAAAHNIGQIAAAIALTRTPALIYYLPVLIAAGCITGAFTGICAQLLVNRLPRIM